MKTRRKEIWRERRRKRKKIKRDRHTTKEMINRSEGGRKGKGKDGNSWR